MCLPPAAAVCCRYTGPDFQEGVSLTYMDEVIKFKKFAYVSATATAYMQCHAAARLCVSS